MKKKISPKRKIILIVLLVLLVFIVYNVIWYFGCYRIYQNYQSEIPEVADSGVRVYVDDDGYNYSVKLPSYLSWTGNLAVTEENIDYALIIWPGALGGEAEIGFFLIDESTEYQIELTNKTTAANLEFQELVDENLEIITMLYDKAYDFWGVELE